MSTLTMALAAALVTGSAAEKVSVKTKEAPSLRFSGFLFGTFNGTELRNGSFCRDPRDRKPTFYWTCGCSDQGGLAVKAAVLWNSAHNQQGVMSLGLCLDKQGYSAALRLGQEEWSFTLRRTKADKKEKR